MDMNLKEAIKSCFRKYATFKGRARRSEFWFFYLFTALVNLALTLLVALIAMGVSFAEFIPLALKGEFTDAAVESVLMSMGGTVLVVFVIMLVCGLAMLLPTLAVTWRRLHDIGKSGGYFFIGWIPVVGSILVLIWLCRDSQPEENRFGPCPKDGQSEIVGFKEAIVTCFRKYATFKGRARRSEFWFFTLFIYLVEYGFGALSSFIGNIFLTSMAMSGSLETLMGPYIALSVIALVLALALFLPSLAVTWRRLHDIGKSGGYYFIGLIPLVGPILLLVWFCRDSQPEDNRFGPNPKAPAPWEY